MPALLKVYARIHQPAGYAIYRINREIVKRAPESVNFVDSPQKADIQIVHFLDARSLTKIWHDKFVLIQHNFLNADITRPSILLAVFNQAQLVVSYTNLPALLKANSFNFHLTAWGVDTDVFRNFRRKRDKAILTTGWSCQGEAIRECFMAGRQAGTRVINVGDDFHFGEGFRAVVNITDSELCDIYNEVTFVSGLRFEEGFELSVIEGLACGAIPICFDLPSYRHWFDGLVRYVPHCRGETLENELRAVFQESAQSLADSTVEKIRQMFSWDKIVRDFWAKVYQYA